MSSSAIRLVSVVTRTRSPAGRRVPDDGEQVVDLALHGAHLDLRVEQPGRPDDLLDDLPAGPFELLGARRRADGDDLVDPRPELLVGQRPIVERRGKPEAVVDQDLLAGAVAVVHPAHLRQGHVRLVDDEQEVGREVVEQRRGRLAGGAAGEVPRVVLDAAAVAELLHHLEVEHRALVEALRLEQAPRLGQLGEPLVELDPDRADRPFERLARRGVERAGIQSEPVDPLQGRAPDGVGLA